MTNKCLAQILANVYFIVMIATKSAFYCMAEIKDINFINHIAPIARLSGLTLWMFAVRSKVNATLVIFIFSNTVAIYYT